MAQQNPMVVVEKAIANVQPRFEKIARPMGNLVRYQEEAGYALQAMRANPYMQRCIPQTIEDAVVNVASIGLSLNPVLQHGFLIPRRKGNHVVCCFDPGYRGLIKLATDGGLVSLVQAAAVYEEEERLGNFKLTRGTNPTVLHNTDPLQKLSDMGEIIGAYCIAYVKHAPVPHVTWMPIDDILKAAAKSEAFNPRDKNKKPSGPWVTDFQEMCVKTAIKRARKQWPGGNARLDHAIQLSNVAESYIEPEEADIEGQAVQVVDKEQADQLRLLCKRAHMRVARVYEKFECRVMEELPVAQFKECHDLLLQAVAHYDVKHAGKGDDIYASDYGLSFRELEDIGATYETEAGLWEKRDG
jgi:phage RecT family recombinase